MAESRPKPIGETQLKLMKLLMAPFSRFHARRYIKSGGSSMGSFGGREICVASMTGAKSGQRRDIPLMYVPYREGVILVASMGGAPKQPTWYYNLVKNPDIDVYVKGEKKALRARQASPAEKAEVWPICCEHYPPYATYQARTDRDIPVFICEPRA